MIYEVHKANFGGGMSHVRLADRTGGQGDGTFLKDLTNLPGKEGLMIVVDYPPPGSTDPIHRHNAHGFIYVLEGSIVMQVRGGKETTVTAGQTFYEGPDDVHVVGRNASKTEPAKFFVFFVKDKNAPVFVAAK